MKNNDSSNYNPLNVNFPLIFRQVNSQNYFMNQKISELTSNLKIDETNDPRDELNFF